MKEKIKKEPSKTPSVIFAIILTLIGIIVLSFYTGWRENQRVEQRIGQSVEWEYFHSTIGQFKILFPVYPEYKTHFLDTGRLDMYIAEQSDGTTYLVEVGEFLPEIDTSNPEILLKEGLKQMLSSEDNELISSNFTIFDGYKTLDFSIRNKKYNFISNGRMMIVEERFYQLIGTDSKENDYSKFINSFQLIK